MTRDGLVEAARYARANNLVITMHLLETADDERSARTLWKAHNAFLEDIGAWIRISWPSHGAATEEDIALFEKYQVENLSQPGCQYDLGVRSGADLELSAEYYHQPGTDGAAQQR